MKLIQSLAFRLIPLIAGNKIVLSSSASSSNRNPSLLSGDLDYVVKVRDSQSFNRIVLEHGDLFAMRYPEMNMLLFKLTGENSDALRLLDEIEEVEFIEKGTFVRKDINLFEASSNFIIIFISILILLDR